MRILILSFYYSPLNNIASTRVSFYSEYLKKIGHEVFVITRHYSEKNLEQNDLDIGLKETDDLSDEYRREDNVIKTSFKRNNSILEKGQNKLKGFKGYYYQKNLDAFHHSYVENGMKAYDKELSRLKFDVIIASSPPLSTAILASRISMKFNIPWIADFRDSPILDEHSFWIKKVRTRALRKLLKTASGIIFVSPGMKTQNYKFLGNSISKLPSTVVFNGYFGKDENLDEVILKKFEQIKSSHSTILTYTGSVYPERNLDFFLSAVEKAKLDRVAVVLVGVQTEYFNQVKEIFSGVSLFFFPKTNYSTSLEIQKRSTALLLTIWPNNYTGFSGKVFEYLNSSRALILDHKPAEDLKTYLDDFKGVHLCQSSHSKFKEIISDLTDEKIFQTEYLIKQTSRLEQAAKLLNFLEKVIVNN